MREKQWLNLKGASEYLSCSEDVLRALIEARAIPYSILADEPLFHPDRLDDFLLSREVKPIQKKTKDRISSDNTKGTADVEVAIDVDMPKVKSILEEFMMYNQSNEIFVNSLGAKLCQALEANNYKNLPWPLYSRLSRWCHPKKKGPRNEWTKERACELSVLLFGKIIEREI